MTDRVDVAQAGAGKVALVAGATRGAGRGIAIELGAAGMRFRSKSTTWCPNRFKTSYRASNESKGVLTSW